MNPLLNAYKRGFYNDKVLNFVAGSIEISNQLISDFIETMEVADSIIDLNLLKPIIRK